MIRIAEELRVFPLLTLMLNKLPYIDKIIETVENIGCVATIEKVEYELQKGGNEMLVIKRMEHAILS